MIENYLPFTVANLRKAGEGDGASDAREALDADFRPQLRTFSGIGLPDIERPMGRKMVDHHIDKWGREVTQRLARRSDLLRSLGAPPAAVEAYRAGHETGWTQAFQAFTEECRRREQAAALFASTVPPAGAP